MHVAVQVNHRVNLVSHCTSSVTGICRNSSIPLLVMYAAVFFFHSQQGQSMQTRKESIHTKREFPVNLVTLWAIDLFETSVVVLKEVQLACVLQEEQGAGH